MKKNITIRKIAAGILGAVVLALALTACGEKPTMGSKINDETGGFDVTAKNVYGTGCSGNVTIAEGECLVVSPVLEKGHFVLTVVPEEEMNALMEDATSKSVEEIGTDDFSPEQGMKITVEGKIMQAYAVEPGAYYVFVMTEKEKTTGTMAVMPRSIEELQAENAALTETLQEMPEGITVPETEIQELPAGNDATNAAAESAEETAPEEAAAEDGQNPVMNYVGPYAWWRAGAQVEAEGAHDAKITIHWGSSAFENTEWVMSGHFDSETRTVEYNDCVRTDYVYKEDGELESQTVVYENGTGRVIFREAPLAFVWEIDQEKFDEEALFEWSFTAP